MQRPSTDRMAEFAEIFERAATRPGYTIDPPFGCVHVALTPESWAEAARAMRACINVYGLNSTAPVK